MNNLESSSFVGPHMATFFCLKISFLSTNKMCNVGVIFVFLLENLPHIFMSFFVCQFVNLIVSNFIAVNLKLVSFLGDFLFTLAVSQFF
jgi:hypothetical protein